MGEIKKVIVFGFVFGIIFSIIIYSSNVHLPQTILLIIPFLVAILCAFGALVATYISNFLTKRQFGTTLLNQVIGFFCAAFINAGVVYLSFVYFGGASISKDIILGSAIGIVIGALYGIYRYRMDRINERVKFLEELSEKNKLLQETTRKLAITEERNRMGRELHDSISQGLHGLVFSLHSLRNEVKGENNRVTEIISYMETTAKSTLEELRTMIQELKPSLLAEEGLEKAITVTATLFSQRKSIPVDVHIKLSNALLPRVEMAIYRITQEALANIEKHAQPTYVQLKLISGVDGILLTINDDGQGFVKKQSLTGNGLGNMRQRAEEENGVFDLLTKPGIGTTIIVKFPPKG